MRVPVFYRMVHPLLFFFFGAGGSSAATIACRTCQQDGTHLTLSINAYLIEYILQLILRQCRTLHIFDCTQLSCHLLSILFPHRLHLLFRQLVLHCGVVPQIRLRSHYQAWHARAMVVDFRKPLLADVLERGWGCDGEADQENISLRV